jgi:hypothetical protein
MIGLVSLDPVFDRIKQRISDLNGVLLIARLERVEGLWGEAGATPTQKRQPWLAVKGGNLSEGKALSAAAFNSRLTVAALARCALSEASSARANRR